MHFELNILQANASDATLLSDLAKQIYIPHYTYLWEPGGVEWYINEFAYPIHKIEAELKDPNNLHYIAYLNKEPIGYIKINICTRSNDYEAASTMELERIYIASHCVQKGVGTKLMQFVCTIARQYHKTQVILKAMDSAHKAIGFYQQMDFEIVGNYKLSDNIFTLMKPNYRGMYILKKNLLD